MPNPDYRRQKLELNAMTILVKIDEEGHGQFCPLSLAVLGSQKTEYLLHWLNSFKLESQRYIKDEKWWPPFSGVVTVFDRSQLNAIVKVFSETTVKKYLIDAHKTMVKRLEVEENFMPVHLCCAHLLKEIIGLIVTYFKDDNQIDCIINLIAQICNIRDYGLILQFFKLFCEFVICKDTDLCGNLYEKICDMNLDNNIIVPVEDCYEYKTFYDGLTETESSPFYYDGLKCLESAQEERIRIQQEMLCFYSRIFIILFLVSPNVHNITSHIKGVENDPKDEEHDQKNGRSNAVAEGYNSFIKGHVEMNQITLGRKRIKVAKLFEIEKERLLNLNLQHKKILPKRRLASLCQRRAKKPKIKNSESKKTLTPKKHNTKLTGRKLKRVGIKRSGKK